MTITLNGTARNVPDGLTVAGLLSELFPGISDPQGLAVAVNLSVVPRSQHAQRALEPGDRVDVVTAVGGG